MNSIHYDDGVSNFCRRGFQWFWRGFQRKILLWRGFHASHSLRWRGFQFLLTGIPTIRQSVWRGFQLFFFSIDEDLNEFVSSIPLTRFIAIFLSFNHHPKEFTKKSLFEFKYGYFASKCKKEVRWGRGGLLGKVDHPKMIREGITLLVFFYSSLKCFPLGI